MSLKHELCRLSVLDRVVDVQNGLKLGIREYPDFALGCREEDFLPAPTKSHLGCVDR